MFISLFSVEIVVIRRKTSSHRPLACPFRTCPKASRTRYLRPSPLLLSALQRTSSWRPGSRATSRQALLEDQTTMTKLQLCLSDCASPSPFCRFGSGTLPACHANEHLVKPLSNSVDLAHMGQSTSLLSCADCVFTVDFTRMLDKRMQSSLMTTAMLCCINCHHCIMLEMCLSFAIGRWPML